MGKKISFFIFIDALNRVPVFTRTDVKLIFILKVFRHKVSM